MKSYNQKSIIRRLAEAYDSRTLRMAARLNEEEYGGTNDDYTAIIRDNKRQITFLNTNGEEVTIHNDGEVYIGRNYVEVPMNATYGNVYNISPRFKVVDRYDAMMIADWCKANINLDSDSRTYFSDEDDDRMMEVYTDYRTWLMQ